jgi:nucleotide-binding universal stress UspA family protein
MFERVIVPLDGSPFAAAALPWARQIPAKSILLMRVEPDIAASGGELAGFDYSEGLAREEAEDLIGLEADAAPLREAGMTVETAVRFADSAAEAIIDEARKGDIIVMTTHGRGSVGRIIHGSTADRVARHATVPVLLLRPGAQATGPERIVVPVDGSPNAEDALPVAAALAKARSIPVRVVRVVDITEVVRERRTDRSIIDAPILDTTFDESREEVESATSRHLSAIVAPLEAQGIMVTTQVEAGTPTQVLLDLVQPSDLIVMTSRGQGGVKRWLIGSVADKLVRESTAPVLLVRPY